MVRKGTEQYRAAQEYQELHGCSWPDALRGSASSATRIDGSKKKKKLLAGSSKKKKQTSSAGSLKKKTKQRARLRSEVEGASAASAASPVFTSAAAAQAAAADPKQLAAATASFQAKACDGWMLRDDDKWNCLMAHVPTQANRAEVRRLLKSGTGTDAIDIGSLYTSWKADKFALLNDLFSLPRYQTTLGAYELLKRTPSGAETLSQTNDTFFNTPTRTRAKSVVGDFEKDTGSLRFTYTSTQPCRAVPRWIRDGKGAFYLDCTILYQDVEYEGGLDAQEPIAVGAYYALIYIDHTEKSAYLYKSLPSPPSGFDLSAFDPYDDSQETPLWAYVDPATVAHIRDTDGQ